MAPPKLKQRSKPKHRASKPEKIAAKIFGLRFRNVQILTDALTHPSYRNENLCEIREDFDRLEFFGDAILNYVVCRKLYALYPKANEGLLSRLRSILVSRKILSRVARELRLSHSIRLGQCLKRQALFSKTKILADCLEALIAGIYFDQGLPKTEAFILRHFAGYFDAKRLLRLDPNPKSTLQELAQKEWQQIPSYASETTPRGIKTEVTIPPSRKFVAYAKTRRQSEEKAARLFIRKIRQELLRRSKRNSSGRKLRKIF